jgi:hypothetical protein
MMMRRQSLQEAKKKKAHVAVRPELAALLPLLLLNILFQNDILHPERCQRLAKPSSSVHRFFNALQSADANAGHGINHR